MEVIHLRYVELFSGPRTQTFGFAAVFQHSNPVIGQQVAGVERGESKCPVFPATNLLEQSNLNKGLGAHH